MFNDRDLGILGAGAVGAILILILPWSFTAKIVLAVIILLVAMAFAFSRYGADRLTLEQFLKRQLVFRFQPRKYSYHGGSSQTAMAAQVRSMPDRPSFGPVSFNLADKSIYWLMTVWLAVIGAYFVYWAYFLGGLKNAAFWIQQIK